MKFRAACFLVAGLTLPAAEPAQTAESPPAETRPVEATSLLGDPLSRPELPTEFRETQTRLLDEARDALAAAPEDPDAAIWVGRRTAYLGRYLEAIGIFSRAIARHPGYAKLYRHRGHRYISIRHLDDAVADLERAAELIAGVPDEVEPDGLPNDRGIPTSTSHTNIWYHLGLAYYLQGRFDDAAKAFGRCRDFAGNPDMLVASSYWLYLSLRRAGDETAARAVLEPIGEDLEIIENADYYLLLRAYAEGGGPRIDFPNEAQAGVGSATRAYGVGAWQLLEGDPDGARATFERVVAGDAWAAFGYIAAEAELARESRRSVGGEPE